ncbi:hypothetical protein BDB01DRAFT_438179 [Pilobolus umbonatus]|nr:hypothetical protein BDB01DRAFT_438179 [Pilobolus umbonatus]
MERLQCAFIGLGEMGSRMAGHISNKVKDLNFPPLLVYNRTRAKAEELKKTHPHIRICDQIDELNADIIFTCLLNDKVVEDVLNALLPNLKQGTIIVEHSTISPDSACSFAKKVEEKGAIYVSCPVMGPPVKAASGKKAINLSENVKDALQLKLCGNFLLFGLVEVLAEGLTLGEASGVGQDKVVELLQSLFPQSLLSIYADRMLKFTYKDQIAFPLASVKKDVDHIVRLAESSNAAIPTLHTFLENLTSVQTNYGEYDLTSVVGNIREKAGLDFDLKK